VPEYYLLSVDVIVSVQLNQGHYAIGYRWVSFQYPKVFFKLYLIRFPLIFVSNSNKDAHFKPKTANPDIKTSGKAYNDFFFRGSITVVK